MLLSAVEVLLFVPLLMFEFCRALPAVWLCFSARKTPHNKGCAKVAAGHIGFNYQTATEQHFSKSKKKMSDVVGDTGN